MFSSHMMIAIGKTMNAKFSLHGSPISFEEVFSPTGLLPAITRRADQLCSLCLGYGLGATYENVSASRLGEKVIFDEVTPDVLRYLCLTDVVSEMVSNNTSGGVTVVDDLMYE